MSCIQLFILCYNVCINLYYVGEFCLYWRLYPYMLTQNVKKKRLLTIDLCNLTRNGHHLCLMIIPELCFHCTLLFHVTTHNLIKCFVMFKHIPGSISSIPRSQLYINIGQIPRLATSSSWEGTLAKV